MSLPDGASYWQNVGSYFRNKHKFTHLRNLECGHHHVYDTWDVEQIDCYACKELLTVELKEVAGKKLKKSLRSKEKKKRSKERKRKLKYLEKVGAPLCKCGEPMIKRRNRQTKEHFWGCWSYPECRGTRPA